MSDIRSRQFPDFLSAGGDLVAARYRIGQQVQEIGGLRWKGRITAVQRTGPYSRLFVQINGVGIAAFYPAQIRVL